jgi:hypothetical protein
VGIAYYAYDGNTTDIYTIDATGGKPFQVTNTANDAFVQSWGSQAEDEDQGED